MRNYWIVLTGMSVFALTLVTGALVWNGAVPGVQAMGMTDVVARMHGNGDGHMHGDAEHHRTRSHADCDIESFMGSRHTEMTSHPGPLHHAGGHPMPGRMADGYHQHGEHPHGEHSHCLTVDADE